MKTIEYVIVIGITIAGTLGAQGCNERRSLEAHGSQPAPGGTVQRAANPANLERSITGVGFQLLTEPPRTPGPRGFEAPFVAEFHAKDFRDGVFYRPCTTWSIEAAKTAVFQVRILDDSRKGQEVYGRLVVFYDLNGTETALPFDPIWVTVAAEG